MARDPLDFNMVNYMILLFKGLEKLDYTKTEIENKFGIKLQEDKCWSEDYIKQVWEETKKIDIETEDRKKTARKWAFVTVLEVLRRFEYDICKQNAAQKNHDSTIEKPGCKARKRSQNSQDGPETKIPPEIKGTEKNMVICDECNYICIPLSKFPSESLAESPHENTNADPNADTNSDYNYKLIEKFPSDTQQGILYGKKSYVMSYDIDKKNAKWVYEILNKSTVPYRYNKVTFKKDNDIDDDEQALDSKNGFKNKDYVRGHLAAVSNHTWCQEAYNDTYLISNMAPQINSMNNGIWKKLENYCRKIIYKNDQVRNVHVYTGPIYKNYEGLTIKGKAVPTHYFKVVILENVNGKAKVECHVVENRKIESNTTDDKSTDQKEKKGVKTQTSKLLTLKEFEKMSGLIFTHVSDNYKVTVKKTLRFTGENDKQATIEVHVST